MNASCFCTESALVRPSAAWSDDFTHSIYMSLFVTFSRSQCWWISTCFNFVTNFGESFSNSRTVCILSQYAVSSSSRSRLIFRNNRWNHRSQSANDETANNSASVVDFVTVFCLVTFQSVVPLNKSNLIPWVLLRVAWSSANEASEKPLKYNVWESVEASNLQSTSSVLLYSRASVFVELR